MSHENIILTFFLTLYACDLCVWVGIDVCGHLMGCHAYVSECVWRAKVDAGCLSSMYVGSGHLDSIAHICMASAFPLSRLPSPALTFSLSKITLGG